MANDLLYGTLNILVLKTLSYKPMHGYGIATWLESRAGGTLDIEDAALYKALHRLEEQGAIVSEWGISEQNRKARYYRLAPAGRKRLRDEYKAWRAWALTVNRILRTTHA
jgi:transcriptional regulator